MCSHRLWDDPTGLVCVATDTDTDAHEHEYVSSYVPDQHDLTEATDG